MSVDLLILGCGYTGRYLAGLAQTYGLTVAATSRQRAVREELDGIGIHAYHWEAGMPLPVEAKSVVVLFPPRGSCPQSVANGIGARAGLVYCSSTSVYGPQKGAWVGRDTPVSPRSPWGVARVTAEEEFSRIGACIVRAAGIYGPGRSILDRARAGRLRVTGNLQRPVNMIHVHDLSEILLAAGRSGRARSVYVAATGQPTPWIDLARLACELTETRLPEPSALPEDPNYRMFYEETKRCRPDGLNELGVQLKFPDTLAALRQLA